MGSTGRFKRSLGRLWGAGRAFAPPDRSRTGSVLVYHAVGPGEGPAIPEERFRAHLRLITEQCRTDWPETGFPGDPTDAPRVRVTFDDGYRDNLTVALPLLSEYRVPATLFIATGRIGPTPEACPDGVYRGRRMLSRDDVRRLADGGVRIGSHTHAHRRLPELSVAEVRSDLQASQEALRSALGEAARELAYPWGGAADLRPDAALLLAEAGFAAGWTTLHGHVGRDSDLFRAPRIVVEPEDTSEDLWAKIQGEWDYLTWAARAKGAWGAWKVGRERRG
ncbi:MAG: polysaccharide deacetylase family protein [Planctomycetes bacterium]|nr:polysaccharide deacetylase family protein [Planctomycetota bacterium]